METFSLRLVRQGSGLAAPHLDGGSKGDKGDEGDEGDENAKIVESFNTVLGVTR